MMIARKDNIKSVILYIILAFTIALCFGFVGSQEAYADADYDRAVNAASVSEGSKTSIKLPWEEYGFDAQYVKFTPSSDGYYELFLYNSYGTPNAEDVWYDVYPSADDAYLQQNDAIWVNSKYLVNQAAEWKIVDLRKGKTYYVRVGSISSNSSYNTYQFTFKKHTHTWTRDSYVKGSFDRTGDAYWTCEPCYESKSAVYPMLDKIVLSKKAVSYTGSAIKPSVTVKDINGKKVDASNYTVTYSNNKKVGKAKVTIAGKGNYTGKKTVTFKINPKSATMSKVTASKKAFTVKWKKQATQTTGYQIQYSTNKNFKSGNKTLTINSNKTVSKKISKLKSKKTYYVRIRTYKAISGTKYYSTWSKAKAVKTK